MDFVKDFDYTEIHIIDPLRFRSALNRPLHIQDNDENKEKLLELADSTRTGPSPTAISQSNKIPSFLSPPLAGSFAPILCFMRSTARQLDAAVLLRRGICNLSSSPVPSLPTTTYRAPE